MRVYGLDFTSAPSKRKPITCAVCELKEDLLTVESLDVFTNFGQFEAFLIRHGPWVAGIDAPFGQPRKFIENANLPRTWPGYVSELKSLGKPGFAAFVSNYQAGREPGDKEHLRVCDRLAGAISPMKLSFVPVGKMFFELAPRLLDSGVCVPPLQNGDKTRVVLETYPGVLVRSLIGKLSYKNDAAAKQTPLQRQARARILDAIDGEAFRETYGVQLGLSSRLKESLLADAKADTLDALLCAVQAAWAYGQEGFGIPDKADGLEGWIADPHLLHKEL